MIYCTSCGSVLPEDAAFCLRCGQTLAPIPRPTAATPGGAAGSSSFSWVLKRTIVSFLLIVGIVVLLAIVVGRRNDSERSLRNNLPVDDLKEEREYAAQVQAQKNGSSSRYNSERVALLATALEQSLVSQGYEVSVRQFLPERGLLVDCTAEQQPKVTCSRLLQRFPAKSDAEVLRKFGVEVVIFRYDSDLLTPGEYRKRL